MFIKLTASLLVFLFLITPLRFVLADETNNSTEQNSQTSEQNNSQNNDQSDLNDNSKKDSQADINTDSNEEDSQDNENNADTPVENFPESGPNKVQNFTKPNFPNVDNLNGSLNYDFALDVIPGRNKMQPDLRLSYNSQANDDNGVVSYGWNFNIPYIERINKKGSDKLYTDNYFTSSLSGELISVGSGDWASKVDNGDFLKYHFENNYWIVVDKNGTTYKFGTSDQERLSNPNNQNNVFRWMLQEIRDANNNYVKYEYYKDSGQIYPNKIKYTGNASSDGVFEIEFLREARPDVTSFYKTGFLVTNNYRIKEIQLKINNAWVKKYVLAYIIANNGRRTILKSITETGKDINGNETVLPSTSFDYSVSPNTFIWSANNTAWSYPVNLREAQIGDVNGDGLPDIVQSYRYSDTVDTRNTYINQGDGTWVINNNFQAPVDFFENSISANLRDKGARLVDVNGDGLVDITYYNVAERHTWLNTGSGWALDDDHWLPPLPFAHGNGSIDPSYSAQLFDVNGDGLVDIVRGYTNGAFFSNVFINNGSGWTQDSSWVLPADLSEGVSFVDVNNDNLPDLIQAKSRPDPYSNDVIHSYINNGHGWTEDPSWLVPAGVYFTSRSDSEDRGTRMLDYNGDGLPDIIFCLDGIGSPPPLNWKNTGHGWVEDNVNFNAPAPLGYTNSPSDTETRIVDIDGDGVQDFIRTRDFPIVSRTFLSLNKKTDVIKKINYSTGGYLDINYKATAKYKNGTNLYNPNLPLNLDVVESIIVNDGSISNSSTYYKYEGGAYNFINAFDRKFAGFSKITSTDNLTKTISYYHQGNGSNSSQGEHQDHVSKIGKMYRQEIYDLNNHLYSKTINKWDRYDLGNDRNFVKLIRSTQVSYDGNSTHKDKAEELTYDNTNGNQLSDTQWGEVNASDNGDFTDVGNDKFATSITYATGANNIVGLPATENTIDQNSNKVKETRYYYDNLALGSVNIGNQTKQEQWKNGTNYINTQKTYNQYGLVTTQTDPLGNQTSYAYDSYNLYPTTITNAANQTNNFSYDYSSGKVINSVDANGQVFTTNYDGLDRPITELQPDPNVNNLVVTKTTYEYVNTPNANRIKTSNYLDANNIVDNYIYFDGLGRKIQERNEAENSGQFNVKDYVYTQGDLLLKESLPYDSSGFERTPITTNQSLYTNYSYDALKRVISAQTVVGTTTNNYDDWQTTITDAKGKTKDLYKDAYDNLVQVNEHNGSAIYSTYYQWNGLKKLTKITDALGNVRNFIYDGLGNVLSAEDLHAVNDTTFGVWNYSYDNAGNVTSKITPEGKTIAYTYDNLNRVLTEDAVGTEGIEASYSYDNCQRGVGRLCFVANSAERNSMSYNNLGQLIREDKRIGRAIYTNQYDYDRQGNQVTIINPDDSQVNYLYNNAGLVDVVQRKEAGDLVFTNVINNIDYNTVGLPTNLYYANGAITNNTYDDNELYRLRHKVTSANGQNVQDLTYTYDPVGNITQIIDTSNTPTAKTTDYTYDDLHRLISATITNSAAQNVDGENDINQLQTFAYDAIGNITYKSDVGTYNYNGNLGNNYANPHAVTNINDKEYSYDKNGNLISITSMLNPEARYFTWDYAGRLSSVSDNNKKSSYTYDVSGQRVKEETGSGSSLYITKNYSYTPSGIEKHIFLGDVAVATIEGTGESAAPYNIHADHLTGSNVITDASQQIDELTDYYSFGTMRIDQQNGSLNEKRKFSGHEYDEDTGLTYANARYYDAALGRWLSEDPAFHVVMDSRTLEGKTDKRYLDYLSNPQELNSYSYVLNNPLKYIDVSGESGNNPLSKWWNQTKENVNSFANKAVDKFLQTVDKAYNEKWYYGTAAVGVGAAVGAGGLAVGGTVGVAGTEAAGATNFIARWGEQLGSKMNQIYNTLMNKGYANFSEHAIKRMVERNLSPDKMISMLKNIKPFEFFHDGATKLGYYDKIGQLFISQSKDGKIITVINEVSQKYIDKLLNK